MLEISPKEAEILKRMNLEFEISQTNTSKEIKEEIKNISSK